MKTALSREFPAVSQRRHLIMFLEHSRKIELVVKAALVGDFADRFVGIYQHFHGELEAAADQELLRRLRGELFEQPAKMSIGEEHSRGFPVKIPFQLRTRQNVVQESLQFLALVAGHGAAGLALTMKLQQQIFQQTNRAVVLFGSAVNRAENIPHGFQETVRAGNFDQRLVRIDRQQPAFDKALDPVAAETDKTMMARFGVDRAIAEVRPRVSDYGVGTVDGILLAAVEFYLKIAAVIILNAIIIEIFLNSAATVLDDAAAEKFQAVKIFHG